MSRSRSRPHSGLARQVDETWDPAPTSDNWAAPASTDIVDATEATPTDNTTPTDTTDANSSWLAPTSQVEDVFDSRSPSPTETRPTDTPIDTPPTDTQPTDTPVESSTPTDTEATPSYTDPAPSITDQPEETTSAWPSPTPDPTTEAPTASATQEWTEMTTEQAVTTSDPWTAPISSSTTEDWTEPTDTWYEETATAASSSSTEFFAAAVPFTTSSVASSIASSSPPVSSTSTTFIVPVAAIVLSSSSTSLSKTLTMPMVTPSLNKAPLPSATLASSSAIHSFEASMSRSGSTPLSSGAIAGIVVGIIVALAILLGVLGCWRHKRRRPLVQDEDRCYGAAGGSNLKRKGTAHSALDFSDDPVSPAPGWRHLSYLGVTLPKRDRASLTTNAGVAGVGGGHHRGMSIGSGKDPKSWETISDEDAHSPPVQVRNDEDFRLTHYDDWLNYSQLEKTPPATAGLNGPSQASLVPPVTIKPLEDQSSSQRSLDVYDAYTTTHRQPVLQRLPWLRVTPPPVSPSSSFIEPSKAEFGIAQ